MVSEGWVVPLRTGHVNTKIRDNVLTPVLCPRWGGLPQAAQLLVAKVGLNLSSTCWQKLHTVPLTTWPPPWTLTQWLGTQTGVSLHVPLEF